MAPVMMLSMNYAVKTVHQVQDKLSMSLCDISPSNDKYSASDKSDGTVVIPDYSVSEKIGELVCERAGVKTDLYSVLNRVSLREGAGCSVAGTRFGEGGVVKIAGYVNTAFKGLENVKQGDIITVNALWGKYTYRVESAEIVSSLPDKIDGEALMLVTAADSSAFSAYNEDKLCVIASLVSGPKAEEVAN